jgi:hypothetical protein
MKSTIPFQLSGVASWFVSLVFSFAQPVQAAAAARSVSVISDSPESRAARYATEKFQAALRGRKLSVASAPSLEGASGQFLVLAGTPAANGPAIQALRDAGTAVPTPPESLAVKKLTLRGKPALVLCGADHRGLMYALLDAAERVGWAAPNSDDPFAEIRDTTESPFVRDRSLSVYTMNRAHWESRFYDERYWTRYLDTLAANRFNRFLIIFGYENGGFLAPPYPYFFNTPGFDGVRMVDLTPD